MTAEVISLERYRRDQDQTSILELETESPLFVDWVTLRQVHPEGGLNRVSDGYVISCDAEGAFEYETVKRSCIEGSFDDRMWLRCDGSVVEFHGNISRWGRRDNVFGYSWPETLARINRLLNFWNLPPFTPGELTRYSDSGWVYSGARVSRIDITVNHATFSEQDAQLLLNVLGSHHVGRQKGTVTPDGSTVLYGYGEGAGGSKYCSGKVYIKHVELQKHRRKKSGSHVTDEVIDFCRNNGVLREEFTLKSRFLTQQQMCFLPQIKHERLIEIYNARTQLRRFKDMTHTDTNHLSAAAYGTLQRWEKNEPLNLKKATFYRHRKELLSVGVDISTPKSNVVSFRPQVRVIERAMMVAPEWYRRKYG